MANTACPLWWYLPTIPSAYRDILSTLRPKAQTIQAASSTQIIISPEIRQLWDQVNQTMTLLRDAQSHVWLARLDLTPWVWDSPRQRRALEKLSSDPLPPYRYNVELTLIIPPEIVSGDMDLERASQTFKLTPAELALITQLDYDLGRRIGDELDGQRPQQPTS